MKISVVSPVYKAEDCIRSLHEELTQVLQSLEGITEYEIVLVEDGSPDRSWEILAEIAQSDTHVHALRLSRNFGQHQAITAGLDVARGDWVVVMDCDLQDSPSYIPNLLQKAQSGYEIVNACRINRKDGARKQWSSRLFHILFEWLSGMSYDPRVANFRIMHRKVLDAYSDMREGTRMLGSQIHWLGFRTGYIDVEHNERREGKSSYSFFKSFILALDVAVAYSNKPLHISIAIGVVSAIASAAVLTWLLIRKLLWGIPVTGWTSLMVSHWFVGGLILANLGVVGIYVGKIYKEIKRRPIYVVDEQING